MNYIPWFRIPIPPVLTPLSCLFMVAIGYAVLKHQLMDIKVAVTRTSVLLATYLIVLGVPFIVGWWGRPWLEAWAGRHWWLVPLGLCTALATAGPFAYAYLRRQAEERLLRHQRRYQRTLERAARGMTRVRDATTLAYLITRFVSRAVGVTHASLFLCDEANQHYALRASHGPKRLSLQSRYRLAATHPFIAWLRDRRCVLTKDDVVDESASAVGRELSSLGAELVIPGLIEKRLIGFLALGQKRSGEGYSLDDLHAFTTLANEAAVAIENALSYEELLKVNAQLKAASERLLIQERLAAAGQFATGMAHEIKNPLSAIKTFAQYLPEKHGDPDFRQKFFRIVQDELDRINTIVKELSDFAKPAPLQLQPIHLSSLVQDTLTLLSDQCLKQAVEVRTAFNENGQLIQADPNQLKQVLLNLLLNSLEAMEQGGRLEVAAQPQHGRVVLTITDTGCGIPPQHEKDIWDPFFTTKERGMGLGLAIVRGVIERHGGEIRLESHPGQGTRVILSLPRSPAQ